MVIKFNYVLHNQFILKYLDYLSYFLEIELTQLPNGDLMLNESKYIPELLVKTTMDQSKPIATPMITSYSLSDYIGDLINNPFFVEVL